ncbi:MAG: hypothetical protein K0R02_78 [Rickettsiaceae bacterium]|jgi:tetratricopeptide (TPR) repeat protein|nr:hypothetical protein [Rickettsiaceae bacterium]
MRNIFKDLYKKLADAKYCIKAESAEAKGKLYDAEEYYNKAIEIAHDPLTYYGKGMLYLKNDRYKEAIECIKEAYNRATDKTFFKKKEDLWFNLGKICSDFEFYDEALKCFQKVIEFNKYNSKAWLGVGVAFYKQGNLDEALPNINHAIKLGVDISDSLIAHLIINHIQCDIAEPVLFTEILMPASAFKHEHKADDISPKHEYKSINDCPKSNNIFKLLFTPGTSTFDENGPRAIGSAFNENAPKFTGRTFDEEGRALSGDHDAAA